MFPSVRTFTPAVEPIVIEPDEGNPFVVNDILFQNELSNANKKDLLNLVFLKKGDIIDERAIEESKKNLNNFFEKDGYTFVKIKHEILNKDNKESKLDLKKLN